jgi:hypothetical protein
MLSLPLLPNYFKIVGWIILIPFLGLGLLQMASPDWFEFDWLTYQSSGNSILDNGEWLFTLEYNNFTDELLGLGLLAGLVLTAFAKTRTEDERTTYLRLAAMLWSVIINTILVTLSMIFIYSGLFLTVMMVNLFSILLLFILRFEYLLWKDRQQVNNIAS